MFIPIVIILFILVLMVSSAIKYGDRYPMTHEDLDMLELGRLVFRIKNKENKISISELHSKIDSGELIFLENKKNSN